MKKISKFTIEFADVSVFVSQVSKNCLKSSVRLKSVMVGDKSLISHKSAYHLFSLLISKQGFSSLQTRKTFGKILSGNYLFLIPVIRVTTHNCAYLLGYNYTVQFIARINSFVMMLRYCATLKAIRYESTSLNRIVADKSHRVIVALHRTSDFCVT